MFDVGFSEMIVIAVVALIVIGPERLPRVARTIGHLVGRMNRYVADVKADINREMEFEELRKFKEEFQGAAQAVEHTIHAELDDARAGVDGLRESLASGASPIPERGASDESTIASDGTIPLSPPPNSAGEKVSAT